MNRRTFVKGSVLTMPVTAAFPLAGQLLTEEKNKAAKQQTYELRTYFLASAEQRRIVESYWQHAAIPALNKMGIRPIGVFNDLNDKQDEPRIVVLIPFESAAQMIASEKKLGEDKTYLEAAAEYLNAPASTPAYKRIESSLLLAFAHMPSIEKPTGKAGLYELRRYESASESAGKKKIEMFNEAGEIDIFKSVGLAPVFFGEVLVGPFRPNLTYMLSFEDMEAHDQKWKQFGSDPRWKKISAIPEYADARIVSKINSVFLKAHECSQC